MKALFVPVSQNATTEPGQAVIVFTAHTALGTVEKATAARDVPPGERWAFHEHRTMAEVIIAEKFATA